MVEEEPAPFIVTDLLTFTVCSVYVPAATLIVTPIPSTACEIACANVAKGVPDVSPLFEFEPESSTYKLLTPTFPANEIV